MVLLFIIGMLIILVGIPIVSGIVDVICAYLELVKAYAIKKITLIQYELQHDTEEVNTFAMGFQAPDEEYCDEDDYDEDCDCKTKNRIGF